MSPKNEVCELLIRDANDYSRVQDLKGKKKASFIMVLSVIACGCFFYSTSNSTAPMEPVQSFSQEVIPASPSPTFLTSPIQDTLNSAEFSRMMSLLGEIQSSSHFNPREISLIADDINSQIEADILSMAEIERLTNKILTLQRAHKGHASSFVPDAANVQTLVPISNLNQDTAQPVTLTWPDNLKRGIGNQLEDFGSLGMMDDLKRGIQQQLEDAEKEINEAAAAGTPVTLSWWDDFKQSIQDMVSDAEESVSGTTGQAADAVTLLPWFIFSQENQGAGEPKTLIPWFIFSQENKEAADAAKALLPWFIFSQENQEAGDAKTLIPWFIFFRESQEAGQAKTLIPWFIFQQENQEPGEAKTLLPWFIFFQENQEPGDAKTLLPWFIFQQTNQEPGEAQALLPWFIFSQMNDGPVPPTTDVMSLGLFDSFKKGIEEQLEQAAKDLEEAQAKIGDAAAEAKALGMMDDLKRGIQQQLEEAEQELNEAAAAGTPVTLSWWDDLKKSIEDMASDAEDYIYGTTEDATDAVTLLPWFIFSQGNEEAGEAKTLIPWFIFSQDNQEPGEAKTLIPWFIFSQENQKAGDAMTLLPWFIFSQEKEVGQSLSVQDVVSDQASLGLLDWFSDKKDEAEAAINEQVEKVQDATLTVSNEHVMEDVMSLIYSDSLTDEQLTTALMNIHQARKNLGLEA